MSVGYLPTTVRRLAPAVSIALVVAVLAALVFLGGSSNPVTPAGYVGYLTRGALFGRERFVALQSDPTSSGRGRLLHVTHVSVTPTPAMRTSAARTRCSPRTA